MTCCTGNICTSWLHCGSACDCKGFHYLQMSRGIGRKTFDLPSFVYYLFFLTLWFYLILRLWAMRAMRWLRKSLRQAMDSDHFPFHQQRLGWDGMGSAGVATTLKVSWIFIISDREGVSADTKTALSPNSNSFLRKTSWLGYRDLLSYFIYQRTFYTLYTCTVPQLVTECNNDFVIERQKNDAFWFATYPLLATATL